MDSRKCLSVAVIVVCKRDNSRKNYRIGLHFDTILEVPKGMNEFVYQPFLTNGSGFIHQKRISKNQKFNLSAKICDTENFLRNIIIHLKEIYEGTLISSYKNTKNHIISGRLTFIFQHSLLVTGYNSPIDVLIFKPFKK